MKILNLISMVLLVFVLSLPLVLAQTGGDAASACAEIKSKILTVINFLTFIAGGVAVIAAIVVGIMFMYAGDPSEKDKLGGRLKALVIGIVIVALANPIVRLLLGSIMDCAKV